MTTVTLSQHPTSGPINWAAYTVRATAIGYIGLLVLLPLVALAASAGHVPLRQLLESLRQPEATHSLALTFGTALAMALINSVTGTVVAYCLVRYEFTGKSLLNSLVDLPFAIPTVVTGLMLVVLYGPGSAVGHFLTTHGVEVMYAKPGIVLALLFVTFPFVVRAVQPLLLEMDLETEEAAHTLGAGHWLTFRRVTLPTVAPGLATGVTLSFARALGEFGSVVIVAGNIPLKTQVASVYIYGQIETSQPEAATAMSLVLLAASLIFLVTVDFLQRRGAATHER
ncbi:MAG: sulfate ABC transporter permease subunit CysT [Armatimonadetes bacterium]|nr:sulfate ABC transporter permease subunit CysT [Armatimonadota bacterium]